MPLVSRVFVCRRRARLLAGQLCCVVVLRVCCARRHYVLPVGGGVAGRKAVDLDKRGAGGCEVQGGSMGGDGLTSYCTALEGGHRRRQHAERGGEGKGKGKGSRPQTTSTTGQRFKIRLRWSTS